MFTFSQKISVNFQLLLRFVQGLSFLLAVAGIAAAIVLTELTVTDVFACILAFIPTGWGILSVRPVLLQVISSAASCLFHILWYHNYIDNILNKMCFREG